MSYEDLESPYTWNDDRRNDVSIWIARTYSVDIDRINENGERETFRCSLTPLFKFLKYKLKTNNVDWSKSRERKWGYKRFEEKEIFDLLNDGRRINE